MQKFCIKCFSFLHLPAWKSFIDVDTDTCTIELTQHFFLPIRVDISVL